MCSRPHSKFIAQPTTQYGFPCAQSHLSLSRLLPHTHPASPLLLFALLPIPLLCRSVVVGRGSGESLIAGPVRRGPWGDLGLKHWRVPRGARVSRTVECGEGWAPGAGAEGQRTFQADSRQASARLPLGDWWFSSLGLVINLAFYFPLPCEQLRAGSPSLAPHSAIIPPFLVEASSESFADTSSPCWSSDSHSHGHLHWTLPASVTCPVPPILGAATSLVSETFSSPCIHIWPPFPGLFLPLQGLALPRFSVLTRVLVLLFLWGSF